MSLGILNSDYVRRMRTWYLIQTYYNYAAVASGLGFRCVCIYVWGLKERGGGLCVYGVYRVYRVYRVYGVYGVYRVYRGMITTSKDISMKKLNGVLQFQ